MTKKSRPISERLNERLVKMENGCIEWVGSVDSEGYGKLKRYRSGPGSSTRAHRVAYEIKNGPIPDGMCVLHICDNKRCCNADHLYLGTRLENNRDKFCRAVGKTPLRHPSQIALAKILIANGDCDMDVSNLTLLNVRTIQKIRLGKVWK